MKWWEARRIPFNVIVGAAGLVSVALSLWIGTTFVSLEPGEDFIEPLALIGGVFIAGFGFNLYYTQAWVAERHGAAGDNHRAYRETVFRHRLMRSCQVATLPIWIALFVATVDHVGRWLK